MSSGPERPTVALSAPTQRLSLTDPGPSDPALLYDGRRVPVLAAGVTIGRSGEVELTVDSERASRRHARVEHRDGGWAVVDLGSKNGTYVNGERVADGEHALSSGDTLTIGGESIRFVAGAATRQASAQIAVRDTQAVHMAGERLTIGRDAACDLVLDDANVSRVHTELQVSDAGIAVRDLGSTNGTFLDGRRVRSATLDVGSELHVGPFRLLFDGGSLLARDERGHLRLDAREVAVSVKAKQILQPTTVSLHPGRFVAIIGESGAGKTTLMKVLAGVNRPSGGAVTVNGEDLALHRTSIGYVPQQEITHGRLTVREALAYAARLRLPEDATGADVDEVIVAVLGELDLTEHAGTRVDRLSGGQRRRVGVAIELLSRPSLLFLDEPTTGLDPGLEARMMAVLRGIADGRRTVALVTHATASLSLVDEVIVMGRGGLLCFQGSPAAALAFFGAERYEDIYARLDETPAREWHERFAGTQPAPPEDPRAAPGVPAGEAAAEAPQRPLGHQVRILAARYARLFVRDRRNALILLGQVPLIALACAGLFDADVFGPTGNTGDAAQLLFLLVTVTIWLGAIDAAREVIKERSVVEREAAIGVRTTSYLLSKLVVLWSLVVVQVALLMSIVMALRPLDADPTAYAALAATLVLTGFAAVAMGLVVSSAAESQDQATSFVPLVLIPQLFFAGAIIPESKMSGPIETISDFVFAKWAFASAGASIDMEERLASGAARGGQLFAGFFDLSLAVGWGLLAAFVAAFLLSCWVLIRRATAQR